LNFVFESTHGAVIPLATAAIQPMAATIPNFSSTTAQVVNMVSPFSM